MSAWLADGDGSLSEGGTAVLECQSDSHGDVQLAWMKDAERLRGQVDVRETAGRSTLTLSDVTSADSGDYVCVATRDHQSVSSSPISISVTGPTIIIVSTIISPKSKLLSLNKVRTASIHEFATCSHW